jgi:hypothetical protein
MEEFNLSDGYVEELKEDKMKQFKNSKLKTILKNGFKLDEERNIYLFNDIIDKDEEIMDKLFHLGFEIEDYSYQWLSDFFNEAYDIINEDEKLDYIDIDSIYDDILSNLEADLYTYDLTKWLNSHASNVYYLTEVLEEYGDIKDGFKLLSLAQIRAKEEVYQIGKGLLEYLLEREIDENIEEEG